MFKPRSSAKKGAPPDGAGASVLPLSAGSKGLKGTVVRVGSGDANQTREAGLERRLLEMGFVEGARVEILHEGSLGRDPIAIKLDDMRVALRRREAAAILVRLGHTDDDGLTPRLEAAE